MAAVSSPSGLSSPRSEGANVTVDTQSIRAPIPEVLPEETPHGCYEGFVYIGHIVEDESGESVEEIERVPCRRCHAAENL
jgi:hypothetical protein